MDESIILFIIFNVLSLLLNLSGPFAARQDIVKFRRNEYYPVTCIADHKGDIYGVSVFAG